MSVKWTPSPQIEKIIRESQINSKVKVNNKAKMNESSPSPLLSVIDGNIDVMSLLSSSNIARGVVGGSTTSGDNMGSNNGYSYPSNPNSGKKSSSRSSSSSLSRSQIGSSENGHPPGPDVELHFLEPNNFVCTTAVKAYGRKNQADKALAILPWLEKTKGKFSVMYFPTVNYIVY